MCCWLHVWTVSVVKSICMSFINTSINLWGGVTIPAAVSRTLIRCSQRSVPTVLRTAWGKYTARSRFLRVRQQLWKRWTTPPTVCTVWFCGGSTFWCVGMCQGRRAAPFRHTIGGARSQWKVPVWANRTLCVAREGEQRASEASVGITQTRRVFVRFPVYITASVSKVVEPRVSAFV